MNKKIIQDQILAPKISGTQQKNYKLQQANNLTSHLHQIKFNQRSNRTLRGMKILRNLDIINIFKTNRFSVVSVASVAGAASAGSGGAPLGIPRQTSACDGRVARLQNARAYRSPVLVPQLYPRRILCDVLWSLCRDCP